MTDLTDLLPLVTLTTPGLLGLAVLLILTDRLVTRRRLLDEREEKDRWRIAYEAEREKGDARDDQIDKLVVAVESALSALGDTHREAP